MTTISAGEKRPKQFSLIITLVIFFMSNVSVDTNAQTINQQASLRMIQFKNDLFLVFGDDNYGLLYKNTSLQPPKVKWEKVLYQFKKLKLLLAIGDVTYVDSLNGYKYRGTINIIASAVRSIRWGSNPDDGITYHGWYPWTPFKTVQISLINKDGQWYIGAGDDTLYDFPNERPLLDDVKSAVNRPNDRGVSIPPVPF